VPKGTEYPYFTEALEVNNIHQVDLVGPRYIKGDGRFYSLHIMDLFRHEVYLESQRTKADDPVAAGLLRCWKAMGIPDFIQFDNELSFRGSNRHPRSFGIVIRLCLHYRVTPVFIPIGEPWRNGAVERFNDTYDKAFFRRQWFPSYEALQRQSKNFQRFHNRHHRYSCLKGRTPAEVLEASGSRPVRVPPHARMPRIDDIPEGSIILIRFIRSDRRLDVFGEKFIVSPELVYSYVKAVIVTNDHVLKVYFGSDYREAFEYRMPLGTW
jgi:putative transposase